MRRTCFLVVAAALSTKAICWGGSPIDGEFSRAPIVVLVQVQESTFPPAYRSIEDEIAAQNASAALLVIASWKGPYRSGATLHAVQPQFCGGYPCITYPFKSGEIVLVFARESVEPISPVPSSVMREPDQATLTRLYRLAWAEGT